VRIYTGTATGPLPGSPTNGPGLNPTVGTLFEEFAMTGTDTARAATGRSGRRLAFIVIGIVVLMALAVWAFSAVGGGDGDGGAPGGPTGPATSPSRQTQTSASTEAAVQPGNAAIALTPAVGPDSRNVRVQGSGFGANEEVVLSVDGTEAKRIQANSSGAFTASLTVPFSKSSFTVRADGGTSNRSASGTVTF
jgi:hypothetical protein